MLIRLATKHSTLIPPLFLTSQTQHLRCFRSPLARISTHFLVNLFCLHPITTSNLKTKKRLAIACLTCYCILAFAKVTDFGEVKDCRREALDLDHYSLAALL